MSSLIFYSDSEQVLVATDTLAVEPNGDPMLFCSKALYLPHIKTIIAGTGVGRFSSDWSFQVNFMLIGGIRNLNHHTPSLLRKLWKHYGEVMEMPDGATTTVYHFGIAEDTNEIVSFAYRSTNDFESEPIQYGHGMKPACELPEGENLVELLPVMMEAQREKEASRSKEDRLFIGGEILAILLSKDGCQINSLYRFDESSEQLQEMFERYSEKDE